MLCANSTEIDKVCSDYFSIRVILFTSMLPVNLIGSALVLRAIHSTKELQKISTFQFIANLAISDISLPLLGCPFLIATRYYKELSASDYGHLETIYSFLFTTKRLVSALTLIALSVDKVLACIFHLKYNSLITTFRVCSLLALIWVASTGIGLFYWAESDHAKSRSCCRPFRPVLDTSVSFLILICFFMILISNIYLMLISREHLKQDRAQRRGTSTKNRRIYENYKSIRSLVLLLCMYGIGLFPLVSFSLIKELIGCDSITCTVVGEYFTIIHYFDLNTRFVVYCCRFRSLRNSVLKVVGCAKLGKQRVEPQGITAKPKENGVANVTMVDEVRERKVSTVSK